MAVKKYKLLKFTISGTYKTADNVPIDYEEVTGVIPYCENEKVALKHLRNRYAMRWIKEAITKDKDYSKRDRIHKVREVYIDEVEEVAGELSFVGKDIRKMSFEELQDFATAKDLNAVPVTKGAIRNQRAIAYKEYAKSIGMNIEKDADIFKLPALKIEDAVSMTSKQKPKADVEELIQKEALGSGDPAPAENKVKKVENPFQK